MIKNFKCNDCDKQITCKWYDILLRYFDEESKRKIGIDIEVLNCKEFKEVEE